MTNIHPTAIIDSDAQIDPSSKISSYAVIKGKVKINKNCVIGSHVIIGTEPITETVKKLDYSVVIEDGCHIFDGTIIQSGCVVNTKIGENTTINYNCLIGHGVIIGNDCFIGLNNSISGLSNLGDNVVSGPGCTFNNRSKVGKNVKIGIGSLVLHEIKSDLTVIGRPAKDINLEKKFNVKLRKLLNENYKSKPITTHWGRFRLLKKILKPVYSILPNTFKRFIRDNF